MKSSVSDKYVHHADVADASTEMDGGEEQIVMIHGTGEER